MEPLGARARSHAGGPVSWGPQVRFGDVTLMHAHFHWKLQSEVTDSCAENACPSGFSPGLAAFESGPGRGARVASLSGNPTPATPGGFSCLGPTPATPATHGGVPFYSDSLIACRLRERAHHSDGPTIGFWPPGASLSSAALRSKL